MGYNTDFKGVLRFKTVLSRPQVAYLKAIFRDPPKKVHWGHIDLHFTQQEDGLEWNGSEKTYDMVSQVNLVIEEMKKICPNFSLEGQLEAQGEEMDDRWILKIGDTGLAYSVEVPVVGTHIKCPSCKHVFPLEAK